MTFSGTKGPKSSRVTGVPVGPFLAPLDNEGDNALYTAGQSTLATAHSDPHSSPHRR